MRTNSEKGLERMNEMTKAQINDLKMNNYYMIDRTSVCL